MMDKVQKPSNPELTKYTEGYIKRLTVWPDIEQSDMFDITIYKVSAQALKRALGNSCGSPWLDYSPGHYLSFLTMWLLIILHSIPQVF
jgi:hypothetical protein